MFNLLLYTFSFIIFSSYLSCSNVNGMECTTDTGAGTVVCHDDGGRRRRLINNEVIKEVNNDRQLLQSSDCPLCENGNDWTCGATLTQCGEQNDADIYTRCYCDTDSNGDAVCWQNERCSILSTCTNEDDCGDGYVCASTCCGSGHCLEKCDTTGNQYDNALPEDCCQLNLPEPCDNEPCGCDPLTETTDMSLCKICHDNVGCSQCENVGTNWKLDYEYPCVSCDSVFEGCLFCQDFNGCGQCDEANYYIRVFDDGCGVWKCQDCRELYGDGCRICQQSQCGQCWDGYTLTVNEDGVQVCV